MLEACWGPCSGALAEGGGEGRSGLPTWETNQDSRPRSLEQSKAWRG